MPGPGDQIRARVPTISYVHTGARARAVGTRRAPILNRALDKIDESRLRLVFFLKSRLISYARGSQSKSCMNKVIRYIFSLFVTKKGKSPLHCPLTSKLTKEKGKKNLHFRESLSVFRQSHHNFITVCVNLIMHILAESCRSLPFYITI